MRRLLVWLNCSLRLLLYTCFNQFTSNFLGFEIQNNICTWNGLWIYRYYNYYLNINILIIKFCRLICWEWNILNMCFWPMVPTTLSQWWTNYGREISCSSDAIAEVLQSSLAALHFDFPSRDRMFYEFCYDAAWVLTYMKL